MTKVIDAIQINEVINNSILNKVNTNKKVIILAATDDRAARRYGNAKSKDLEDMNIKSEIVVFNKSITQENLQEYIKNQINDNSDVIGCIIQLPLYDHLDADIVLNTVHPFKDIDCLTYYKQGSLYSINNKRKPMITCTAHGTELIISQHHGLNLTGKSVVIVGRGPLVADPLAKALELKNATVTKVHTGTFHSTKKKLISQADIVISCAGKDMSEYINPDMVKHTATIIGVGFRYIDGKQIQDFNVEDFVNNESFLGLITSNTNATGLATRACFKLNTMLILDYIKTIQGEV